MRLTATAAHITREPEQVKAFRDTWRDGIHSYLSYLRDRLTVARDLLSESGSIFVQIGDENVHRVRALMDEAFGEENFAGTEIVVVKTSSPDQWVVTLLASTKRLSFFWYGQDVGSSAQISANSSQAKDSLARRSLAGAYQIHVKMLRIILRGVG